MDPNNLNPYLQPLNAPVSAPNDKVNSPFDFGQNVGRNSITQTKIRYFNFSSGTGGTLTLGGTNNGNGYERILDSNGTLRITINNNGFLFSDGTNNRVLIGYQSGGF